MAYTEIDRPALREIRAALEEKLSALGSELGIDFSIGSARFSPSNATIKLELALINEDGSIETREAKDFKDYCFRYGMTPDDLGKEVTMPGGKRFTIIGCKPRSHKYPIILQRADGKRWKYGAALVRQALAK